MKSRWTAGILTIITAITLIAAPAAEARGRRASGRGRRKSSSNVHEQFATAHLIGALIGLAFLNAAVENNAPAPQPAVHVCRKITRREWVPGRYEPYTEKRWVPTRRGGYYEEFTAHRWVKGYYHTVIVTDPHCCK